MILVEVAQSQCKSFNKNVMNLAEHITEDYVIAQQEISVQVVLVMIFNVLLAKNVIKRERRKVILFKVFVVKQTIQKFIQKI